MLRFVSIDPTPTTTGALSGAYLVGKDNVAIAGEVTVCDGIIVCEKGTTEAVAIAVQLDLDQGRLDQLGSDIVVEGVRLAPLGTWTLQTCLLPQRESPYLLVLELARHRIMMFLTKLEDWQAIESTEGTLPMRLFDIARESFIQAMVCAPDSILPDSKAAKLALRALWIALEASERLALQQAERDFTPRNDGSMYESIESEHTDPAKRKPILHPGRGGVMLPFKPAMGSVVSPNIFAPMTQDAIARSCDFITVPMRWTEMEPAEGEYDYSKTDRWIEWAIRQAKIQVVGGPLIDFRSTSVPEWLYIWENDYETLRELVYEHIKTLVTRYRRTVTRWTVCSGLHCGEHFKLSFEQMMDLTRICVLVTRKLHPRAKIQVEITQPWGEYHTHDRSSLPPLLYAEMLSQAGIQIDAFSLRMQMGSYRPGLQTRDLLAFSAMLDQYAMLDRPITISSLGVPTSKISPKDNLPNHPNAGMWRQPWSEALQADWLSAYAAVALSKPYIESICWHELADPTGSTDMRTGGLMDIKGLGRPALDRMTELRTAVAESKLPPTWSADALLGSQNAPT
ncbi:MAG: endo-1,4-beta-xylanase [Phycisphaerales bacterium]|nr:endo-1,4-beta-xylanase [Phycisphaerales bacterium]